LSGGGGLDLGQCSGLVCGSDLFVSPGVSTHRFFGLPTTAAFAGAASHLVGVQFTVSDHLHPLVRDWLGKDGQEIDGVEDFEVAVDLGIEF